MAAVSDGVIRCNPKVPALQAGTRRNKLLVVVMRGS